MSHVITRDGLRMPFYDVNDERLSWLEEDFLHYYDIWRRSSPTKSTFLTTATYEALVVTTRSTVLCTRHLLDSGFHYVLTGKFSSDAVESLFSSIRQLNGYNDRTDAKAALSALHKVLVTGVVQGSSSSNVTEGRNLIGEQCGPLLNKRPALSDDAGIEQLKLQLQPHIQKLTSEVTPPRGMKTATLALVAGFLAQVVKERTDCSGCLRGIQGPSTGSPNLGLVHNLDRGGLSYPTAHFLGFVCTLEETAQALLPTLLTLNRPLQGFIRAALPEVMLNPLFHCNQNPLHCKTVAQLVLMKFLRPFIDNTCRDHTQRQARKKLVQNKPT
ncbi:uncharacterized protein LOC135384812 [Ornithodoros turicata]|uniref:uncharacterized protein LOC135384812 n=1 Tax=Ornithodoros turicata TaxID=34597 RepID=UPI00313951ED